MIRGYRESRAGAIAAAVALGLSAGAHAPQEAPPPWQDPAVFEIGREPPRASFTPFPTAEAAVAGQREDSPRRISLNGVWKFHFVPRPADRPGDFFAPGFDDSGWDDLPVPSNWELHAYGYPVYRDESYSFPANPPFVPEDDNPVGSYRRDFEIPARNGRARRSSSASTGSIRRSIVWVNGGFVGYSEGSRTPAEFRITEELVSGPNTLAVQVIRWSDGSYLESQDFWRISGIDREVSLLARPLTYLRDFSAQADLVSGYRDGILDLSVNLANRGLGNAGNHEIRYELFDPDGNRVWEEGRLPLDVPPDGEASMGATTTIRDVRAWSAETPNLYRLVLSLVGAGGEVREATAVRIGFRRVETADGRLLRERPARSSSGV